MLAAADHTHLSGHASVTPPSPPPPLHFWPRTSLHSLPAPCFHLHSSYSFSPASSLTPGGGRRSSRLICDRAKINLLTCVCVGMNWPACRCSSLQGERLNLPFTGSLPRQVEQLSTRPRPIAFLSWGSASAHSGPAKMRGKKVVGKAGGGKTSWRG